jgi:hypothetical protein
MATPSAAAGTANPSPASSAATPVDDGLAAILSGPSAAENPEPDPSDPEPPDADPEDPADDSADPDPADPAEPEADPEPDPAPEADPEDPVDPEDPEADPEKEEDPADPEPEPAEDPKKKKDPLATLDGNLDENLKRARAKFTPEQQKVFDSAVSLVRPQLAALQGQLAQVTPELDMLRQTNELLQQGPVPVVEGGNPLAKLKTEAELATHLAQVRKGRQWALRNPKGGVIKLKDDKGNVVEQEISEERVGEILAETEEALQVHGPAHEKFLRDRRDFDRALAAEVPWAGKKGTPGHTQMEAVLHRYPWLNQTAEGRIMAADLVIGAAVRAQNRAARGKPAPKPGASAAPGRKPNPPGNPPPVPGGQRPPRIAAAQKVTHERVKRFEKTGQDEGNGVLAAILTG